MLQPDDDFVVAVESIAPAKALALDYLDNDGPPPPRYALVTVMRGSADPLDCMEYRVGPIPSQPQAPGAANGGARRNAFLAGAGRAEKKARVWGSGSRFLRMVYGLGHRILIPVRMRVARKKNKGR
jgi:Copper amine oxidase, N2 domain